MNISDTFYILTNNGSVKEINVSKGTFKDATTTSDRLLSSYSGEQNADELTTIHQSGVVRQFALDSLQSKDLFKVTLPNQKKVVQLSFWKNQHILGYHDGTIQLLSSTGKTISETQVGQALSFCSPGKAGSMESDSLATGGEENDLQVWRLEDLFAPPTSSETTPSQLPKPIFAAKNVPQSSIKLRCPVWPKSACFLSSTITAANETTAQQSLVLVGTAYGELRLYDIRGQKRRPLHEVCWCGTSASSAQPRHPITTLCEAPLGAYTFFCGNSIGTVGEFDLRRMKVPVCHYKGLAGGAVQLLCPRSEPRALYSIAQDAFVRIHDRETQELAFQSFLISKPARILLRDSSRAFEFLDAKCDVKKVKKRVIQDTDLENIWGAMDKKQAEQAKEGESELGKVVQKKSKLS